MIIIASIVTCFLLQTQGADKYTDGNRPYEFGFSIDGEQHRHEKKDEKGLIMGEFGFITADGVYHVTVYATDEQGRFKILSMKNIRVKPYPTYTSKQSTTSARQGHSLDLPAPSQSPAVQTATSTENSFKSISINPPGKSCSSCSIPTTSTLPPIHSLSNQAGIDNPNQVGTVESGKFPGDKSQSGFGNQQIGVNGPLPPQTFGQLPVINQQSGINSQFPQQILGPGSISSQQNGINSPLPQQTFGSGAPITQNNPNFIPIEQELVPPHQNYPTQPQTTLLAPQTPSEKFTPQQTPQGFPQQTSGFGSNSPAGNPQAPTSINSPQLTGNPTLTSQPKTPAGIPQGPNSVQFPGDSQSSLQNVPSGRSPKRLDDEAPFGSVGPQPNSIQRGAPNTADANQRAPVSPDKPTLISAQMQIVDKNTDIYHRGPGEQEGLPKGLTKDDMTHLLYTFNYTVGFHGHFEEGYTNGVKQGYYFVTGRNGVKTRIDYVADSEGFHPKISQEVLDLLSDDVPKPETEKEEKYGLKGYEFKWLYYPTEITSR